MFFHTQLLISALLAASVLGAPNPKRDDDPCKGLGSGTYSNLAKFRLAAFHSGRNQHEYGNELVLGTTGLNSTTFREAHWETNPSVKDLTLVNGGITSAAPATDVGVQVSDNDVPYFSETTTPQPPVANIWCGVPANEVSGKHKFDLLAVHGRYDLWSSCYKQTGEGENDGVYRIAYNVDRTKRNAMFEIETCVPVNVTIVRDEF